jgi:hypothetical protein
MLGGQLHGAGLLLGPDPYCPRASHQGEGIVADDLGRSFQSKDNGVSGVRTYVVEFIGDTQHHPCRIRAVGNHAVSSAEGGGRGRRDYDPLCSPGYDLVPVQQFHR